MAAGAALAARAQDPASAPSAPGSKPRLYSAEMPDMLVEYFAHRLDEQARRWDAERATIRTRAQLTARNRSVREKLREMLGPFPAKPPLNARLVRTIQRQGYRIENVVFQSRPDYWVPANVYVPSGTGPFPGVVLQRGHFDAERMSPDYQQLYFDLAMNGFAVLAFDPVGQGERRQYYGDLGEGFEQALSPTLEHCAIGGLLSLLGETAANYFVWDGMRAVDYLSARPDVNRAKIGLAGHPDTGLSALLLAALDERIQCAALYVHGSARRWPLDRQNWNTTDDPEQHAFPAALHGVDVLDTLVALAPRPLLALVENQTGQFGAGAESLRGRYGLLGAPAKFAVETARPGVDWPKDLRLAALRWFQRWMLGQAREIRETEVIPEPYAALRTAEPHAGQSIYSIIREHAAGLPPRHDATPDGMALLRREIGSLLALPMSRAPLGEREVSTVSLEGYWLSRVEFLSEPGIYISAQVYRPNRSNGECVVYVAGDVTQLVVVNDDGPSPPQPEPDVNDDAYNFARGLVRGGVTVVVADVRGVGLTQPLAPRRDYRGLYEHLHNSDVALANMAWALGDSLFAMRVRDVLRAIEYGSQFGRVRLAGSGMGALWALYAAAVEPRVEAVAVEEGLLSYRVLTSHGRFMHSISQFIPGVLRRFDLPQVAGAIAPRKLTILDPVDHMKNTAERAAAEAAYQWTREAYANQRAPDRFRIAFGEGLARDLR